jgi:hypothetical protein
MFPARRAVFGNDGITSRDPLSWDDSEMARRVEEPRHEAYGVVAVFEDLCGNRWDLIQRKSTHGCETRP